MAEYDLFLKDAQVVFEDEVRQCGVAVKEGKIAGFTGPQKGADAVRTIVCTGRYLLPGGIDTHTHFFEPGPNYREDVLHGTRAAAAGGYTTVMDMPNTDPPVDSPENFRRKEEVFSRNACIDYMLWGASLPGRQGEIAQLKDLGCPAFKAFTSDAGAAYPKSDSFALFEGMEATKKAGGIFGVHAEDQDILDGLREKYGEEAWDLAMHDRARPWYAELSAMGKVLLFAGVTGCPLHICHTSIPEGIELVKQARKLGVDASVETCPHYLLFDFEQVANTGAYSLICPPIRSRNRVDKMWEYVASGDIDYMGTDHAPYTDEDKNPENLWDAPGGAPNIDVAIPAVLEEGVRRGLPLPRMAAFLAGNAARRFGLYPRKGVIREGVDADLMVVDMDCLWTYSRKNTFSKTKATGFAYEGRKLTCRVEATVVRGEVVYEHGKMIKGGGYGKLLKPDY